ncbi:wax ester/triacylglycerol synthase family O-acyltransferase [Moraxella sp. ZY200743]|uniref:wax ester/triacylglycerol synthase family O-acyltransferase n=1 Tax=Moraxella sp. ZY200743 TaxID=2911970 RepID=UPI003D7DD064
MRPLSLIDLLFLLLESAKQPMHVSGLCLFDIPQSADDNFINDLITKIKNNQSAPSFPFNQVLKNYLFWNTVKTFDISHHFRHIRLDTGSDDELMTYISHQHSIILDRNRPLWQLHFIEGLSAKSDNSPKRFAIYLKAHHAMADGVAAMRLLERSFSSSPDEPFQQPFWSSTTKYRTALPLRKSITSIIKEQIGTIKPVMREIVRNFKHRHCSHTISTFDAPPSMLNQRISNERTLIIHSLNKHRFLAVAQHHSVTTNDVILAVCAGALRDYLNQKNALPNKPLLAFVPIGLRQDDSSLGNQLSFLLTNLATHEPDPIIRLHTISQSINQSKKRFLRMNPAQIINYSALTYGWAGINLATRFHPTKQAFNLIISNVPSDTQPLYLHGARLTSIFPASVLFDGQALNITLTNHQDTLDFGITACRTALPDIEQLPHLIESHLSIYEQHIK